MTIGERFKRLSASLGPGLITAAVVLGPGSMTMVSRAGAGFGYDLLWVVLGSVILMAGFTVMAARLGTVARETPLALAARLYGRWLSVLVGLLAFFVVICFQAGNNAGVASAFQVILGPRLPDVAPDTLIRVSSWFFTLLALGVVLFARNLYKTIERLMTAMVLVMIVCFLINLIPARPSPLGVAAGFVPSMSYAKLALTIPILATTFSVIAALYQAYIVQNRGWTLADYRRGIVDAIVGIGILALLSMVIMTTAAAVLHPAGIKVASAGEMAVQLTPLLGSWATVLFAAGLWGASFSSLVANAVIGGGLFSDGLGMGWKFESRGVKAMTALVMLVAAVVVQLFGRNPLDLIQVAQATTILALPLCAFVLLMLVNRRDVMGEHRNGLWLNLLGALGFITVTVLAARQAWVFLT